MGSRPWLPPIATIVASETGRSDCEEPLIANRFRLSSVISGASTVSKNSSLKWSLGFLVLIGTVEKIDVTRRSRVQVEVVCVAPNHHKPSVRRDHQLDKLFEILGEMHSRVP